MHPTTVLIESPRMMMASDKEKAVMFKSDIINYSRANASLKKLTKTKWNFEFITNCFNKIKGFVGYKYCSLY